MAQQASTPPSGERARGGPLRIAAVLASAAILIASCGTNSASSGAGGSAAASAAQPSAAASAAASGAQPSAAASSAASASSGAASASSGAAVSGTLTVWAMGNEGVKLKDLADAFMKDNPGTTVNVTPVDWGQAVAKLQTAIAGHQTPDVSQMGTDMMGQFAATGAFEPVPSTFDKAAFFEGAWNTNIVNGALVGVPWYVETRLLYYRTDIAQKAGITSPPA